MKEKLIQNLVSMLLDMLDEEMMKSFVDKILDFAEDFAMKSSNKIDDIIVIGLCKKIRQAFDIPDNDIEIEFGKK